MFLVFGRYSQQQEHDVSSCSCPLAILYPPNMKVFAVPHRFRLEPVGTSWILIRNFGSQYRPNDRKILQFFQPEPVEPVSSTGSESNQFQPIPSETGQNWSERVRPVHI